MAYANYKSLLDKFNDGLPFGNLYHSLIIVGFLYGIGIAMSIALGEQTLALGDSAALAAIFGIAYMVYMETRIGNHLRAVAVDVFQVFGYDSAGDFRLIFDNRLRGGVGVVVSLLVVFSFFEFLAGAVWYNSWILRAYLALLAALIGFIGGDAVVGLLAIIRYVGRISEGVKGHVDAFNPAHEELLRTMAKLGSLLSIYGGVVTSVVLVAFFFAPWKNRIPLVSELGIVFLLISIILLASVFLIPLTSVHGVMSYAKGLRADALTRKAAGLYGKLQSLIAEEKITVVEREAQALNVMMDSLNRMNALIGSMPEWPIDIAMLRAFSSSVAIPIIVYVVEVQLVPLINLT
jgi:hypothetical protein